jgi:adenosine deaminase
LAAQNFSLDRSEVKGLCERVIDSIFTGAEEQSRLRTLYASWDGWIS